MVLQFEALLSQLFFKQRIQHHRRCAGVFEMANAVDLLRQW